MASVYISIFGFVLVTADSVLFFYRFTQKDKLLWMHTAYFLAFFISSIVSLAQTNYTDYMESLKSVPPSTAICTANGYLNECLLAEQYLEYRGHYISFFVVFLLFFIGYTVAYHYAVLKVQPYVPEEREKEA